MTSFEGVHAWILEDDQSSVDVLKSLLTQAGVSISVMMGNIEQKTSAAPQPNVIFLDLEMPGSNGYQVLAMLRSMPSLQGVPIVAYTTHTSHLNQAHDAGFDSFLGKPIDRRNFVENLARILNGESVWEIS